MLWAELLDLHRFGAILIRIDAESGIYRPLTLQNLAVRQVDRQYLDLVFSLTYPQQ